jgi:DNA-binding Lrp family transcriptional regulator
MPRPESQQPAPLELNFFAGKAESFSNFDRPIGGKPERITTMQPRFDLKDLRILAMIQDDCRLTAREISVKVGLPITTVFARIKRMEKAGIIKGYHAVLDAAKLNASTTAFVLASFAHQRDGDKTLSQREVAREVARFPEVQEVHIISGDWDILIKVRASDVESVGKFVVDKLRLVKGVEKTLTCLVFESQKETTSIPLWPLQA